MELLDALQSLVECANGRTEELEEDIKQGGTGQGEIDHIEKAIEAITPIIDGLQKERSNQIRGFARVIGVSYQTAIEQAYSFRFNGQDHEEVSLYEAMKIDAGSYLISDLSPIAYWARWADAHRIEK